MRHFSVRNATSLILSMTLLVLAGCTKPNGDVAQLKHHDDGRAKPVVAFFDVIDCSDASTPWNLADEFTQEITGKLKGFDQAYIIPEENIAWEYPIQPEKLSPFKDHNWLRENHPDTEFIVFTELVSHDIIPVVTAPDTSSKVSYNLIVSMRVKVIDLRHDAPQTILQEIVTKTQYIPWQFAGVDYNSISWGKTMFPITPMGLAHSKVIKTVAQHIEDYVLLAKTE